MSDNWLTKKSAGIAKTRVGSQASSPGSNFLSSELPVRQTVNLTPDKLISLLDLAERGSLKHQAELAAGVEARDSHVFSELSKRRGAIAQLDYGVFAAEGATSAELEAASVLNSVVSSIPGIGRVMFDMTDAILKGYSCIEIEWYKTQAGLWAPKLCHRPASWFTVPQNDPNLLMLRSNNQIEHNGVLVHGEYLNPMGWIPHVHKSMSGSIPQSALIRVLAWLFIMKMYSLRDLMRILEIHGMPMMVGRYPHNATPEERNELVSALVSLGSEARGIMPVDMAIDFHNEAKGAIDPYKFVVEWCENSQSKAILGGVLTSSTTSGTNTNALGKVHLQAMWDIIAADAVALAESITEYLVKPLVVLNELGDPSRFSFKFDTDVSDDLTYVSSGVKTLVEAGAGQHIPVKWVMKRLKIPAPMNGEPTLGPPTQQAGLKSSGFLSSNPQTQPNAPVVLTSKLSNDAGAAISDGIMSAVKEALSKADSLSDFAASLDSLFTGSPNAKLVKAVEQSAILSELSGMADVLDGE